MYTKAKGSSKASKASKASNSSNTSSRSDNSPSKVNHLAQLPKDIVLGNIVERLGVGAQIALAATSKHFNDSINTRWRVSRNIELTSRLSPAKALVQFNKNFLEIRKNKQWGDDAVCSLLTGLARQIKTLSPEARKTAFDKLLDETVDMKGAWVVLLKSELRASLMNMPSMKDIESGHKQLEALSDVLSPEEELEDLGTRAGDAALNNDVSQCSELLNKIGKFRNPLDEQALLVVIPRLGALVWNKDIAAALLTLTKRCTSHRGDLTVAIAEVFQKAATQEKVANSASGQMVFDFLMEQIEQLPTGFCPPIVDKLLNLYPIIQSKRSAADLLQQVVQSCVDKNVDDSGVWNRLILQLDSLIQQGSVFLKQSEPVDIKALLVHFANSAPDTQDPVHVKVALTLALELPGEDGKQALSALGALNTRLINKCNFGAVSPAKHCKDRWKMEFLISFADAYVGQWEGLAAGGVYGPLAQALSNMDESDRDAIFMMLLRRTKGALAQSNAMEALAAQALKHASSSSNMIQLVSVMPDDASRTALYSAMWKNLIATGNAGQNSSSTDIQARKFRLFAMLFEALPHLQDKGCRADHVLNLAYGVHALANKKEREKFVKQLKAAAKAISPECAAKVKFALKRR